MKTGIKTYMGTRSIRHYQTLMQCLMRHHGSQTKVCKAIGLSDFSYHRLVRDDELTVANARKILAGYDAIKNQEQEAA